MSYILDALRKADAERERDPARGIHAHAVAMQGPARTAVPVAMWAGGAAILAAVAAFVLWPRDRVAAVAPVQLPAQVTQMAPPPPPAPATAVLPPAPPEPATLAPTPARPVLAAATPAAAPPKAPAGPAAPSPSASAALPAGPSERIFAVTELPADIQRELPKLPISGGVYSENAAQRMLIVSGVVANEGTEIAPGLVVEQIRPKNAVLKFRGWKYSVGY